MTRDWQARVGFAVGTGRCGTTFLAEVMKHEPHVASTHQRNDLSEAFHRYCKWYGLDVDDEGFLVAEETAIRADLVDHCYSFESSGYLSFSIQELHERFRAKFVLLVRRPDKVVNSYIRKAWYAEPYVRGDTAKPLGYQSCGEFHHFLGRIAPAGEEFTRWNAMTRVGKLAWYWTTLNEAVLRQFEVIPTASRPQRLEDLNHSAYGELARFLGFEPTIGCETFDAIVAKKPNARRDVPSVAAWSPREAEEFEAQVAPLAQRLGYEYRVDVLRREADAAPARQDSAPAAKTGGRSNRLRAWLSRRREAA